MKLHRFYVGNKNLDDHLIITEKLLVWQWLKVLRLETGQQLSLFNQAQKEAHYKILDISKSSVGLQKSSDLEPNVPTKEIHLFWSLLKRDNNELILQKCTELGVSGFTPIISERTIKKDFNLERTQKIVIEASEQCGRIDIPSISEPMKLNTAIKENMDSLSLLVADQKGVEHGLGKRKAGFPAGIFIGPEGGWSDAELELFKNHQLTTIKISAFTLRAETAAIVAASKLL